MTVKLLTEHPLECLSLKGDFTGSYESSLVKMPHCWKSHAMAHIIFDICSFTLKKNHLSLAPVCDVVALVC